MSPSYSHLASTIAERLRYVTTRGEDLAAEIQQWQACHGLTPQAVIADDRLSWELRINLAEAPPLIRWGHIFGDAISALRSTLNNLVWGIAQVEGIQLQKPRVLQFPIAETVNEWKSQRQWIKESPASAQKSIEQVQPFQRTSPNGTPAEDLLLVLRQLSNRDKHELALLPDRLPQELTHQFSVQFPSDDDAAAEPPPHVELNPVFTDGAVLFRQVTRHPIVKVQGSYALQMKVVVLNPPNSSVGVTSGLAALCYYLDQVCGYVLTTMSHAR